MALMGTSGVEWAGEREVREDHVASSSQGGRPSRGLRKRLEANEVKDEKGRTS